MAGHLPMMSQGRLPESADWLDDSELNMARKAFHLASDWLTGEKLLRRGPTGRRFTVTVQGCGRGTFAVLPQEYTALILEESPEDVQCAIRMVSEEKGIPSGDLCAELHACNFIPVGGGNAQYLFEIHLAAIKLRHSNDILAFRPAQIYYVA